jgi:hypothetical protein
MHLVGFTIGIYYDARTYERKNLACIYHSEPFNLLIAGSLFLTVYFLSKNVTRSQPLLRKYIINVEMMVS